MLEKKPQIELIKHENKEGKLSQLSTPLPPKNTPPSPLFPPPPPIQILLWPWTRVTVTKTDMTV